MKRAAVYRETIGGRLLFDGPELQQFFTVTIREKPGKFGRIHLLPWGTGQNKWNPAPATCGLYSGRKQPLGKGMEGPQLYENKSNVKIGL